MTFPVSNNSLGWLLDEYVLNQARHTRQAILLSADGLPQAWTHNLTLTEAESAAAAISSMQSLASNAALAQFCGESNDGWENNLNTRRDSFMLLAACAEGSYIAVVTARQADLEEVGMAITRLAGQLGPHLSSPQRVNASAWSDGQTESHDVVQVSGQIDTGTYSTLPRRGACRDTGSA